MVIHENGELCTCGRRGCLEAYASATALVRDTKHAMEKYKDSRLWELCGGDPDSITAEMTFAAAAEGDPAGKKVVYEFIRHLSIGIVNIVNIFRPEAVLLGGGISAQGRVLTDKVNEMLREECFGKEHGQIPEVKIAELGNKAGMIGAANLLS